MLEPEALERLRGSKNLLAFSGGVDSTALFFLLKDRGIECDLALVNYRTRPQSDEEAAYAEALGAEHGIRTFVHTATLSSDASRFEAQARRLRYDFFDRLVQTHGYDNLLTAHQLDDLLEWGLMQLCRGCGTAEFVGMAPVEEREGYHLVRPLLFTPKSKLLEYLKTRDIRYFVDTSNLSDAHTRNRFRKEAAGFLLRESPEGVARSFRYMLRDKQALLPETAPLFECEALTLLPRHGDDTVTIRRIDRTLKAKGYLLSAAQKSEIMRQKSAVIGGKWVVAQEERAVWIAPATRAAMPKSFKERCRKAKIPEKVRPYLFVSGCLEALLSVLPRFSS